MYTELWVSFVRFSVEAVAYQQASYITKWLKFTEVPGHRNPILLTLPPSSIVTLQSTLFKSSLLVHVQNKHEQCKHMPKQQEKITATNKYKERDSARFWYN